MFCEIWSRAHIGGIGLSWLRRVFPFSMRPRPSISNAFFVDTGSSLPPVIAAHSLPPCRDLPAHLNCAFEHWAASKTTSFLHWLHFLLTTNIQPKDRVDWAQRENRQWRSWSFLFPRWEGTNLVHPGTSITGTYPNPSFIFLALVWMSLLLCSSWKVWKERVRTSDPCRQHGGQLIEACAAAAHGTEKASKLHPLSFLEKVNARPAPQVSKLSLSHLHTSSLTSSSKVTSVFGSH